jgi:hypothetical protein
MKRLRDELNQRRTSIRSKETEIEHLKQQILLRDQHERMKVHIQSLDSSLYDIDPGMAGSNRPNIKNQYRT